jgi:hypothetical protein
MKYLLLLVLLKLCFATNINNQNYNILHTALKVDRAEFCTNVHGNKYNDRSQECCTLTAPFAIPEILSHEIPKADTFVLSNQEKKQGFKVLFDGTDLNQWTGDTAIFVLENGELATRPKQGNLYRNLYTKNEYSNFDFRFEFQLTAGANNGVGIRAPLEGNAAYQGMELQIIDNDAEVFKNLKPYQYHGSIYGVIPAKRGYLKPVGEWNYEEVIAKGPKIKVILNGAVILDGDITEASESGTMDHLRHPGLKRASGHIGFLGHASVVKFRNIRIKEF